MGYDIAGLPVTFLFVNQACQTYGFEIEVPAEILPDRHCYLRWAGGGELRAQFRFHCKLRRKLPASWRIFCAAAYSVVVGASRTFDFGMFRSF